MTKLTESCEGGCGCGQVRYKLVSDPLIIHCCHCRWCQRQTGAAFALNALFEAKHVVLTKGIVNEIMTPSPSGLGQTIARCPKCQVAVWSNYYMGGLREKIRFIRVGTLDNPDLLPPDIHIFTESKQPWVILPPEDEAVEEFYEWKDIWSEKNFNTLQTLREALSAEREREKAT